MATKTAQKKGAAKRSSSTKAAGRKTAKKKSAYAKASASKSSSAKASKGRSASPRKWSHRVNETSDSLDLQPEIFKSGNPKKVAGSLKRSAEKSTRKKTTPFQSAMSMLNFYINRGGKNLAAGEKKVLEKAKNELRKLYHRPAK